jgi:hypothetical protein
MQQVTDPKLGTFWVFDGGAFGVRSLHVYLPASGVIFAPSTPVGFDLSTGRADARPPS